MLKLKNLLLAAFVVFMGSLNIASNCAELTVPMFPRDRDLEQGFKEDDGDDENDNSKKGCLARCKSGTSDCTSRTIKLINDNKKPIAVCTTLIGTAVGISNTKNNPQVATAVSILAGEKLGKNKKEASAISKCLAVSFLLSLSAACMFLEEYTGPVNISSLKLIFFMAALHRTGLITD